MKMKKDLWRALALAVLAAQTAAADPVTTHITPSAVPEITWSTRPTGVYALYRSESQEGPFDVQVGTNVTSLGYSVTVADTAAVAAGGKRYYRVETVSPGFDNYLIVDVSGGAGAETWPVTSTNAVPELLTDPAYRTTKLVLRAVPAGTYEMQGTYTTTLTRPFYVGVFEVTQAQYTNMVGGANPSENIGERRPVENVSYSMLRGGTNDVAGAGWPTNSAVAPLSFMGLLREKTGNVNFDLPTEAQWEYACRAGTTTAFHNDNSPTSTTHWAAVTNVARCYGNQTDAVGGYASKHTTVGSFLPNAWGLYDLHGNVAEWCLDWEGGLADGAVDPGGPAGGSTVRKIRGGAFSSPEIRYLSNADRPSTWRPDGFIAGGVLGFRVALRLPEAHGGTGGDEAPAIERVSPVAVPVISWPTRAGGVYGLFRSAGPDGPFETQIGTNLVAGGASLSLADGTAAGGAYVYRVEELAPGYARYMVVDVSAGSTAESYPVVYTNVIPELLTDASYKTNRIVLRVLPAGTFTMGTPAGELGRNATQEYLHPVTFTKPFYISVFEVTRGQYRCVQGGSFADWTLPSNGISYDSIRGSTNATDGINWPTTGTAVAPASFMGRLRARTGLDGFDLPTDAQWEYACRAGTTAAYNNGNNPASTTDYAALDDVAIRYPSAYAAVGSRRPNGWGLYDMHGNVAEWCLDWFAGDLRPAAYAVDPVGPASSGSGRVTRGSARTSQDMTFLRSGRRGSPFAPNSTYEAFGIRLVGQLPD
jgi:formylglycine-generating enzyme required for sulfatase activity